jgi:RNA polymerase sigma-70 factor (family 1)
MKRSIIHIIKGKRPVPGSPLNNFAAFNEASFSAVFSELYPLLIYYSRKIIFDEIESEHLVADVFVKAWERRLDFETYPALKSFLYHSVRNASLDRLKKQKRLQRHKNGYAAQQSQEQRLDQLSLEYIIEAEFLRELYNSFDQLPAQCKKVMHLFYTEGKTHQEIATQLKLSLSTVRNQKARGISLLRKLVELPLIVFALCRLSGI